MKHIILIGFMGAGKSTIGRKLARRLQLEFVDTDDLVEELAGQKISDIFAEKGEACFRQMETEVLRRLGERTKPCVIAVGGGLPMQPVNRPLMKMLGTVVFLEAEVDTLIHRLRNDTKRPMLQGGNLREKIETLMEQRRAVYLETADVRVPTDTQGYSAILQRIIDKTEIVKNS